MPWWREHDENSILISDLNAPPSTDGPGKHEFVSPFQSSGDILAASSELLAHLQRSGLRFVPNSAAASMASWEQTLAAQFTSPATSAGATSAGVTSAGASEVLPENHAVASQTSAPNLQQSPRDRQQPSSAPSPGTPVASSSVNSAPYPGVSLPVAEVVTALDSLSQSVAGCTRCKALASCRTQTVFGEGSPQPRFVFFGEAPGAEEDKTGRPFVGAAGQLLTKMIEAIQLKREDVYLLNTVKCRPPGNRNPAPDEVANCREYFETQLQLLRPEYIVCLGAVSSQALLQSKLSIGRLRQTFHQYHDSKVIAIYHPAYLLRNPDAKRAAWADLQMLMKDAGLR